MTGFLAWVIVMVLGILVLLFKLQESRGVDRRTEETSLTALKEIGRVATKKHQEKFGRPPTNVDPWNPKEKEKGP